jgi:hypothetical protein
MAHWPSGAGPSAHFAPAVQRAMPPGSPLIQTLGRTDAHREHQRSFPGTGGSPLRRCMGLLRTKPTPKSLSFAVAKHLQTATQAKNLQSVRVRGLSGQHRSAQTQKLGLKYSGARARGKLRRAFKTRIHRFVFKSQGQLQLAAGLASVWRQRAA